MCNSKGAGRRKSAATGSRQPAAGQPPIDFAESVAARQLVRTLHSAHFQQIRANYQLKFDRYDERVHWKQPGQAEQALRVADALVEKQDFRQALKVLNEGILHAAHESTAGQPDSELHRCLQQRALCFRRLDYLEECVADVDSLVARGSGVQGRARDRLRKWRADAQRRLAGTLENLRAEQAPDALAARLERYRAAGRLHGASDALRVQHSPSAGRGLYTTRQVDAGELLLVQAPYASVLSPSLLPRYCSQCLCRLSKLGAFFPCRRCTQVRYCSADCERDAWTDGHQVECSHLDILNYSQEFHLQPRLALRVLLKGGVRRLLAKRRERLAGGKPAAAAEADQPAEQPSVEAADVAAADVKKKKRKRKKKVDTVQTAGEDEAADEANETAVEKPPTEKKQPVAPASAQEAIEEAQPVDEGVESKLKKRRRRRRRNAPDATADPKDQPEECLDQGEEFAQCSYEAICSLKTHSDQCPDFAPPVCLLLLFVAARCGPLSPAEFDWFGCELLGHLQRVQCNAKHVLGRQLRAELPAGSTGGRSNELLLLNEHRVGSALYTSYSLLNHDCEPNALTFHFDGHRLHVHSLRALQPGEQAVISYGVCSRWQSYAQRADFLRRFYYFACDCASCMRKEDANCSAYRCAQCNGPVQPPLDVDEQPSPTAEAGERKPAPVAQKPGKCHKCGWAMKAPKMAAAAQLVATAERRLDELRRSPGVEVGAASGPTSCDWWAGELQRLLQAAGEQLHEEHGLQWRLLQMHGACARLLGQPELAAEQAVEMVRRLERWTGPAYSVHFNGMVALLDRQLGLLRQTPGDDRLRLRFLQNLKTVKLWMDVNLAPNTDEYMYFLSFLSLSFSGYSELSGRTAAAQLDAPPKLE